MWCFPGKKGRVSIPVSCVQNYSGLVALHWLKQQAAQAAHACMCTKFGLRPVVLLQSKKVVPSSAYPKARKWPCALLAAQEKGSLERLCVYGKVVLLSVEGVEGSLEAHAKLLADLTAGHSFFGSAMDAFCDEVTLTSACSRNCAYSV
jgi:hypothetical protein